MNCSCQIRWCIQLKQNRGQNEIMKIMKILRRIYVLKKKKQRLSAKIMTRPIVQSAPNAIDCNVYIYENSSKNTLSKCLNGFLEVLALIVLAQLNVYGISGVLHAMYIISLWKQLMT